MSRQRKRKKKKNIFKTILECLLLGAVAVLLVMVMIGRVTAADDVERSFAAAVPAATEIPAEIPVISTPEPTPEPTPTPTPEPTPQIFTFSCVGDLTLWSSIQFENSEYGLPLHVNDDYTYPFKNTKQYFENDEFTISNLECTFSDTKAYSAQMFYFLAPTAYAQILTNGGVDFVTCANNHTMDFYESGVQNTQAALDQYGIPYGYEGETHIETTPNGLKVGIYTSGNDMLPNKDKAVAGIAELKAQGVDYIICMFHWGQELYYSPNDNQTTLAHACIDAGANLVYGSHPHCLQPIEEYNGGIILYSMGNWVFGGSTSPSDPDTAIVQVSVKRDVDGTVSNDGFNVIPCCVSSNIIGAQAKITNSDYNLYGNYNDYCPTPYEEGSEDYLRVIAKLAGSFEAKSQGADYSNYYASWG